MFLLKPSSVFVDNSRQLEHDVLRAWLIEYVNNNNKYSTYIMTNYQITLAGGRDLSNIINRAKRQPINTVLQ